MHILRTIADADRLRNDAKGRGPTVIVGGGYIGLEVAATLRAHQIPVTILETAERVMGRVVCPEVSEFFAREHERQGVHIECGARVQRLDSEAGRVRAVVCSDGRTYPADVVLVAVGAAPADELAAAAGLSCDRGVVVDENCRTSDSHIFAAGDCANQVNERYGQRLRLESVDNAFEQGTCAALSILGLAHSNERVPWFWSDQYDLKLVIVGVSQGYDQVIVRGEPKSRSFSVCYLREGALIALDTINSPKEQMAGRKLVGTRASPSLDKLADASVPLRECL